MFLHLEVMECYLYTLLWDVFFFPFNYCKASRLWSSKAAPNSDAPSCSFVYRHSVMHLGYKVLHLLIEHFPRSIVETTLERHLMIQQDNDTKHISKSNHFCKSRQRRRNGQVYSSIKHYRMKLHTAMWIGRAKLLRVKWVYMLWSCFSMLCCLDNY